MARDSYSTGEGECLSTRWLIRRDLPCVLRIECESFNVPWEREDFVNILAQRHCVGMVAEIDEQVVGYVVYELYSDHTRIVRLAVCPENRRAGVGSALLRKICSKLSLGGRNRVLVDARESLLASHLFFKDRGFRAVRLIPGGYTDTGEDAYCFLLRYHPELHDPRLLGISSD